MAASDPGRWVFTKDQLQNTPSRRCNVDYDKELSYRQQAATLIQEMGQRLSVTQLCINTAIVYMHRFYMFHSFTKFHRNSIASCALFLAAKVEEQPRKLEHVIKIAHMIIYRDPRPMDTSSEQYLEQAQELITNENILLQTLGFDVAIDHPHTQVLKCCQLVRAASRDMAQTSYFMATNSLHLTTMCLQYKPTVVACVCIHLVCKWFNYEIPQSNEGKDWFWYVDKSVTLEQLEELTVEFLAIFNKCPSRLRRRVMQQPGVTAAAGADSAHHDAHSAGSHKARSDIVATGAVKPGEKVPRPHEQRREKITVQPSSSSSIAPAAHRPSSSGHPHPSHSHSHPHSSRPPESSGASHHHHHHHHHTSFRVHSEKQAHPHSRPINYKDVKPQQSSTQSAPSQQQPRPHASTQLQQQQLPSNQQLQQRKPIALPSIASVGVHKTQSSSSLFSPPQGETVDRRSAEQPKKAPAPLFSNDLTGNGNSNIPATQSQHQRVNLDSSMGFSLDFDLYADQDSTWDINYGLEPSSVSPTAAIESMLSGSQNSTSAPVQSEVKNESTVSQPQQSLFDLLAPSPKFHQPSSHPTNTISQPPMPTVTQTSAQQQQQPPSVQPHKSMFDLGLETEVSTTLKTVKSEDSSILENKTVSLATAEMESGSLDPIKVEKKKKKKKEKHKNKDKDRDKEKDKEKKHKHKHKEKDKHRDKNKEVKQEESADQPPKIKISLPQMDHVPSTSSLSPEGNPLKAVLKLKIPKGRIESESTAEVVNGSPLVPPAQPVLAAGGLKIKISRDMISSTKDKESRKRDRSSTTVGRSTPAAKIPKIEPTQPQQSQQQTLLMQQQTSIQSRPHHERNGSVLVAEEKDNRHRAHSQRPMGPNKVSNPIPPYPPPPYSGFPPPQPFPSYPPQPFYPYPTPGYSTYIYPYGPPPPMPMLVNTVPPQTSGADGLPPLPREPPPQAPPPPPPPTD